MEYKEFKKAFFEEGITQEKIINRLWILRLGHYSFSDNFKTKEELQNFICDLKEFIAQLAHRN